jgi:hypothetical protein
MNYQFTQKNKIVCFVLMAIGLASIAASFITHSHQAWGNLLMNNFYFMAIALGATFFLAVQYVAEVGWSAVIKRVLEAMGQYLIIAGIIMVALFWFGKDHLYHWTHHDLYDPNSPEYDEIMVGKSAFLNVPFFCIRMVLYFVIWYGFARLFRKESLAMEMGNPVEHYKKNVKYSAIFLVLFAITSSTSAWDFIMSIDAHWFSTLFGWYTFAGLFISSLCILALLIIYLKSNGYMPEVNDNHIHDIGRFMFAFSIFWTYLWFAQFMLIWYANLPEEVTYFMTRFEHYRGLFIGTFFVNFICPFLVLMSRDAKKTMGILAVVASILFVGHWMDMFVMIIPGTTGEHGHITWMEIGTTCGFAGAFLYSTLYHLSKAPLVAKSHPMMQESLHHTT